MKVWQGPYIHFKNYRLVSLLWSELDRYRASLTHYTAFEMMFRQKGVVRDMIDGTSTLSVVLDDGREKTLELGKQGIRLVPLKQKRSKS